MENGKADQRQDVSGAGQSSQFIRYAGGGILTWARSRKPSGSVEGRAQLN